MGALLIDIAVNATFAISAFWAKDALGNIQSGAREYSASFGDQLQFWANVGTLSILTWIAVGLALVKWLNSCYRYSSEGMGAIGFENDGWTTVAWIVPILNLFKPYLTPEN